MGISEGAGEGCLEIGKLSSSLPKEKKRTKKKKKKKKKKKDKNNDRSGRPSHMKYDKP